MIKSRSNFGIALLTVFVFVSILILFGAGLMRYMVVQRAQIRKLDRIRAIETIAQSLAVLAVHKLTQDTIADLRNALSAPISTLVDSPKYTLDLRDDAGKLKLCSVVNALLAPQGEFSTIDAVCEWRISAKDFKESESITPIERLYPAVKKGYIHIYITLSYRRGNQPNTNETFHFLVPCKVTLAFLPILSKFTLYVENAVDNHSPDNQFCWNLVKSDEGGRILPDSPTPLVLKNGNDNQTWFADLTNLETLLKKQIGLVYLGKSPLTLFLAYGDCGTIGDPCNFGESMHFYQRARPVGSQWPLYQYRNRDDFFAEGMQGYTYHLAWDRGHCASGTYTQQPTKTWLAIFQRHPYAKWLGFNSIIRLFGPDSTNEFSPTIVLGEVYRGFQRGKCFKVVAGSVGDPFGYNAYLTESEYNSRVNDDSCPMVLQILKNFAWPIDISYNDYRTLYSSEMIYNELYNHSLAFFATQYRTPKPRDQAVANALTTITAGDPLDELVRPEKSGSAPIFSIPGKYGELAPGKDLKDLNALLDLSCSRPEWFSWVIDDIPEGSTWDRELAARGLLIKTPQGVELNLNGWVLFKNLNKLVLNNSVKLISNGGIVLEHGDISLSGTVTPDTGTILYLVTRNGDIEISGAEPTWVSLAAGGKLILNNMGHQREWGDHSLKIIGSVAAKSIALDSSFKGGGISFLPELSAYPGAGEERICVSLAPQPIMVGN